MVERSINRKNLKEIFRKLQYAINEAQEEHTHHFSVIHTKSRTRLTLDLFVNSLVLFFYISIYCLFSLAKCSLIVDIFEQSHVAMIAFSNVWFYMFYR